MFRQPQDPFWNHDRTDEIIDEQPAQPLKHGDGWQKHSSLGISFNPPEQKSTATIGIVESAGELPLLTFGNTETAEEVQIDRAISTRNLCCIGLCIGWAVATACIIFGALMLKYKSVTVPAWLVGREAAIGPNGYSWVSDPTIPEQSLYLPNHRAFHVPQGVMVIVPLLLNVALTCVFDTINLIHQTSLRWQLWQEGRLEYNSNPRLFSCTKRRGPNKWYFNILSAFAIISSYGGLSVLDFPITVLGQVEIVDNNFSVDPSFDGPRYGIDFNAWGLSALGVGLFLQSFLSTWCLVQASGDIGTWSSNPLAVARVCKYLQPRGIVTGKTQKDSSIALTELSKSSMNAFPSSNLAEPPYPWPSRNPRSSSLYSVNLIEESPLSRDSESYNQYKRPSTHDSHGPGRVQSQPPCQFLVCSVPQKRQPCASFFVPQCKRVVAVLWVITALATIWTIVVAIMSVKVGTASKEYVDETASPLQPDAYIFFTYFGQVQIPYDNDVYTKSREWRGLIVQICVLALPMLGLHYAEVIIQMSRDEAIWRQASTAKGANPDSMVLVESARYWPCWVFFIIKCLVPWIYSLAINSFTRVAMTIIPLSLFTFLFLVLTIFLEYLIRYHPRGPQPAAFGNIGALIELVEDWSQKRIFWGDKGVYPNGVKLAGTAGYPLPPLDENSMYTGLGLSSKEPVGKMVDVVRGLML